MFAKQEMSVDFIAFLSLSFFCEDVKLLNTFLEHTDYFDTQCEISRYLSNRLTIDNN